MKNIISTLVSIATVALIVGCGDKKSDSDKNKNESTKQVIGPDGKPQSLKEYYRRFLFYPMPCDKDKNRYYHEAHSENYALVDREKREYVSLDLYLLESGNFIADINLVTPRPDISSSTWAEMKTDRVIGKWSINDERIVLENLGSGRPLIYNGGASIFLTLEEIKSDHRYNGRELFVIGTQSTNTIPELQEECN